MTAPEKSARTTVEAVIAELDSSYRRSSLGPSKQVTGVSMDRAAYDAARSEVTGQLVVTADLESPHGDCGTGENKFTVNAADIAALGAVRAEYRRDFERMAKLLSFAQEQREMGLRAEREAWYDAGLPVEKPVAILRPLRFRNSR